MYQYSDRVTSAVGNSQKVSVGIRVHKVHKLKADKRKRYSSKCHRLQCPNVAKEARPFAWIHHMIAAPGKKRPLRLSFPPSPSPSRERRSQRWQRSLHTRHDQLTHSHSALPMPCHECGGTAFHAVHLGHDRLALALSFRLSVSVLVEDRFSPSRIQSGV